MRTDSNPQYCTGMLLYKTLTVNSTPALFSSLCVFVPGLLKARQPLHKEDGGARRGYHAGQPQGGGRICFPGAKPRDCRQADPAGDGSNEALIVHSVPCHLHTHDLRQANAGTHLILLLVHRGVMSSCRVLAHLTSFAPGGAGPLRKGPGVLKSIHGPCSHCLVYVLCHTCTTPPPPPPPPSPPPLLSLRKGHSAPHLPHLHMSDPSI